MRQVLKLTGKVGIYGCSLGGIPASYLPSVRDVELVICDRTFSSLDAMAEDVVKGLYPIYKLATYLQGNDNARAFLTESQNKVHKLIMIDVEDTTVPLKQSLMHGVARKIREESNLLDLTETKALALSLSRLYELEDALFHSISLMIE